MSEPDGVNTIVSAPTDSPVRPVPGSLRMKCSACGTEVWVSPATLDAARGAGEPFIIVCAYCYRPRPDETFAPLSPAQIEELRRALKSQQT